MTDLIKLSDIPDKGHSTLEKRRLVRSSDWNKLIGGSLLFLPTIGATILFSPLLFHTSSVAAILAGSFLAICGIIGTASLAGECAGAIGGLIDSRDPVKFLPPGSTMEEAEFEGLIFKAAKETSKHLMQVGKTLTLCEATGITPPDRLVDQCEAILERRTKVERAIERLRKH